MLRMVEEVVRRFYAGRVKEEWNRQIGDPYHMLEHDTAMHYIDKYVSGRKNLILDAGGGPGRYTVELARKGNDVVLLDPVVENLKFAQSKIRRAGVQERVKETLEGSIEDLSAFPDGTFDIVLCLSAPLSHVMKEEDRARAASELVRVLKGKGLLFVSVIGRLAALVYELESGFKYSGVGLSRRLRDEGDYHGEHVFTAFHGFMPDEFRTLFENTGNLKVLEMVGLEGISSHHSVYVNGLAKRKVLWRHWMETHYKTCAEPSIVGLAEHILIVAQKR